MNDGPNSAPCWGRFFDIGDVALGLNVAKPQVCLERTGQERVVQHAQNQANDWPNEHPTHSAPPDSDDTSDARDRKGDEGAAIKASTNKDGSSSHREGENRAAQFPAETAESPEEINPL
jgi:hypothetical protein